MALSFREASEGEVSEGKKSEVSEDKDRSSNLSEKNHGIWQFCH